MSAQPDHPACPLTGEPASRRIQTVSISLLRMLWRVSFGIRPRQLDGLPRISLWESPCGLGFFEPKIEGDDVFYGELYRRYRMHEKLGRARRPEFAHAAAHVAPGASVLDVGGGEGAFSRHVGHARYVGLDPHAEPGRAGSDIRAETIGDHARTHPDTYDVVCAFQVVEHVADPVRLVGEMATALKPGGRLVVVVPRWPSAMTEVPNFVLNAPPHHLTWWTEGALRVLATQAGLGEARVEALPPGTHTALIYWMGRFAPALTGDRFFRHAWAWHLGLLWAWLAGTVANALRKVPDGVMFDLMLVAEKPR